MRLTPFIHLTTRLHRRELFDTLRFPVGKNYEDAFTTPLILEQVTKAACVGEPVSYTHLTLPTKRIEEISEDAVS